MAGMTQNHISTSLTTRNVIRGAMRRGFESIHHNVR